MRTVTILFSLIGLAALLASCNAKNAGEKALMSADAGNSLTVRLSAADGVLKHGNTEFKLAFVDASGNPVDVGAVGVTFHMPQMGTMAEMNDAATLTTTNTPGVFRSKANVSMAGVWQVRITYEGSAGRGQATFPVTVQ